MKDIKCDRCPLFCGLINLPTTYIPKDEPQAVPGKLPTGEDTLDIREFCRNNYISDEN